MNKHQNDWPPEHSIRYSNRAKRASLVFSNERGLEVVVPRGEKINIHDFLQEHEPWIRKQYSRYRPIEKSLPEQINLRAIEKCWSLKYLRCTNKRPRLHVSPEAISVMALQLTFENCQTVLLRFLRQQAQEHLTRYLELLSNESGLSYENVSIRGQNTLWGSCTREKNISLNEKLLFLPKPLTRHILLHELCHTIHLNHGRKFWTLLKRFDPDCEKHRTLLKQTDHYIPPWIFK